MNGSLLQIGLEVLSMIPLPGVLPSMGWKTDG
jgi:hypothetical protein